MGTDYVFEDLRADGRIVFKLILYNTQRRELNYTACVQGTNGGRGDEPSCTIRAGTSCMTRTAWSSWVLSFNSFGPNDTAQEKHEHCGIWLYGCRSNPLLKVYILYF
jgi:hypothetical protein